MNSDILYSYYKGYIEGANNDVLYLLKSDITNDKNNSFLTASHYAKLLRLIAKRRKEIRVTEVA